MGKETFPCASPTRYDQICHAQGGFHSTEEDAGDASGARHLEQGSEGSPQRDESVGWTFQDR